MDNVHRLSIFRSGQNVVQVIELLGVKGEDVGKQVAKLSLFQLANPRATAEDAQAFLLRERDKPVL